MKAEQKVSCNFSPAALGLGLVTAALAESFYGPAGAYPARSALLLGGAQAAGLWLLARLFGLWAGRRGLFGGQGFLPRLAGWLFFLWFAAGFARTAAVAQTVCREEFGSNALIAVLPLLLLAVWQMDAGALDRSARALWWLLGLGAAACLAGLGEQLRWQRLWDGGAAGLWAEGWPPLRLYPEYFALPLLCSEADAPRAARLPWFVWAVQGGYALVLALVLGRPEGPGYTGLELLRAWAMGYFSRLDALLLLIWLAAALWRLCLLAFVLRRLARVNGMRPAPAARGGEGAQP